MNKDPYKPITDKGRYVLKTCGICKEAGKLIKPLGKYWNSHWQINHPDIPKRGTVTIEDSKGVQSEIDLKLFEQNKKNKCLFEPNTIVKDLLK